MSMLEDLADEIPPELYDGLCGGISYVYGVQTALSAKNNDLLLPGETL